MSTTFPITSKDRKDAHNHHLLLIGGGPRGIIQTTSEIIFMLLYKSHFDRLTDNGARYQINTTIVDKQQVLAVGNSCCAGQTGMMNTGIEDDIQFPLPLPPSTQNEQSLNMFLSYKQRYQHMLQNSKEQYYNQLKNVNLPGAIMFKNSLGPTTSTFDGQLDHSGAYLMRTTVGMEEYTNFETVTKLAKSNLPFYNLQICNSSLVHRIEVGKKGQHLASVQNTDTAAFDFLSADHIRLNTGTTIVNPFKEPTVRNLAFCQPMNAHDFKKHCSARQLLDDNGLLRAGIKMLSGGSGLSGLDQISVLNHVMNLFEEDESQLLGYRVSDEARVKYQGAITLLSRHTGRVVPPRHSSSFEWLQGTPVMGRTKNLHALFLHSAGEQVFGIWMDILKATIARATYFTPDQVSYGQKTMKAVLRSQFEETKWFLQCRRKARREELKGNIHGKEYFLKESSRTLYGAWRQAALSLIFGFGLEQDAGSARGEMTKYAPLTWKGREFWLFHRGQVNSITEKQFASHESNKNVMNNFSEVMRHVTSSPVEIQSMFHLISEAGIARHVKASYSEIRSDGKKFHLQNEDYDGLVVSPVFDRNENEMIKSLAGQVKPYHEAKPTYGEVGKFRRLLDADGSPLSIQDNGLGGKGFIVEAEKGGQSRIGSFATDVNNRASAVSIASSCTLHRMAMAHLKAAGIKNPEKVLDELYEQSKPSEKAYNEEVEKFKVHFEDTYEMWAYLEAIKYAAGDDAELFRILFDAGLTRSARKDQMRKMGAGATGVDRQAFLIYKARIKETPVFNPPSRDAYLARFVDTTDEEDMFIYNGAYDMALRHLQNQQNTKAMDLAL